MRTIPVEPQKSQSISVNLDGQQCLIRLVQRTTFIYMDLEVNGVPILQGVPCLYGNKMVRYQYLGFRGDLVFIDNLGESNPYWDGLGDRYAFYYIEESDLVQ
ncbi:phage baseplate plug family protein [Pectobacterium polaris]|uniref:phage baseplate plug family protein n=1 Tax=Pectobacterium polaris TaxID=2042057 RepID=UPI003D9AB4DA